MKFLLSANPKWPMDNAMENKMELYNVSFDCHPSKIEEIMKEFLAQVEIGMDMGIYTTNNLLAMKYLPDDCFLWVDRGIDEDGNEDFIVTPFWEVFSAFKGLSLPDVYYMACCGKLPRDKKAEAEGKVKYLVPPLEEF